MNILPYSEITTSFRSSNQRTLSASSSDFKKQFTSYRIKTQIKDHIQSKRNEMLNRFHGLTESKWNKQEQDQNVESMMSPYYSYLSGMRYMNQGVIQRIDDAYYLLNPVTGELYSNYPRYGVPLIFPYHV